MTADLLEVYLVILGQAKSLEHNLGFLLAMVENEQLRIEIRYGLNQIEEFHQLLVDRRPCFDAANRHSNQLVKMEDIW